MVLELHLLELEEEEVVVVLLEEVINLISQVVLVVH
tara:strand:+ start:442 stop:549 length:108 start_codon:yes stop_codon:yes gene_type:complete